MSINTFIKCSYQLLSLLNFKKLSNKIIDYEKQNEKNTNFSFVYTLNCTQQLDKCRRWKCS